MKVRAEVRYLENNKEAEPLRIVFEREGLL
jgi:hypothetical protein